MSKSDESKILLVDYHQRIAVDDFPAYDYSDENASEEDQQLAAWKLASNPNKWKRTEKYNVKPLKSTLDSNLYFSVELLNEQGQYYLTRMPRSDFAVYREFTCAEAKLDTALKRVILEDHQGKLYIGSDNGD